jgi:hypothetical protein
MSGRQLFFTGLWVWMLMASLGKAELFAQSQQTPLTIHLSRVPLSEALDTLASSAKVSLSYNPEAIGADRTIDLHATRKPLNKILDQLLPSLSIEWQNINGTLILKPAHKPDALPQHITLSGYVRDSLTGEVLIGATVLVAGTTIGTTTNGYGFYSIRLPAKPILLEFNFMGYAPVSFPINIKTSTRHNQTMRPALVDMSVVEVSDQSYSSLLNDGQPGQMKLTPLMLSQLPGFAGQKDVVRSLASLPGITSFGDGSALFFVRGGAADQNLLMVDEAPVYNPAHLFGFFTALAPDAISDVEAFKGDFPARYGGRISSVIHVRTKDGNLYHTSFSGNINPYASNLTVEGPILENRSSYYLAARVSNLNWIKPENGAIRNFDFGFYDVNAKFNIRLNDNNRLFVTLFGGADRFTRDGGSSLKTYGIDWQNQVGVIRWNHLFGQKLFSNTTVYFSRYDYKLFLSKELEDYWNSSINNLMGKTDFSWFTNNTHTIRGGAEFGVFFINPGNVQFSDEEIPQNTPLIPKYRSRSLAFYLSDEWKWGNHWQLNLGFRLSTWRDVGPTTLYTYDALHRLIDTQEVPSGEVYDWFVEPEPRLSLLWKPRYNFNLTFSYGRSIQYLQVVSNSTSPFTSLEVWVPAGPNRPPQKGDQVALSMSMLPGDGSYALSSGLYYRWLQNQVDYADNANLLYNQHLESELRTGSGKAYGLELMARKVKGRLTGWMSYVWSQSWRTTPEVNNGEEYAATAHRPHSFTLALNYQVTTRICLSGAWYYLSGAPFTAPVAWMQYNGYTTPVYADRHNDQLPDYHRLDLSATFILNRPGNRYQHQLLLAVYNAYGRYNPFSINYNKVAAKGGDFVVPSDLSGSSEIVPTTLSASGIVPSINYQFRF